MLASTETDNKYTLTQRKAERPLPSRDYGHMTRGISLEGRVNPEKGLEDVLDANDDTYMTPSGRQDFVARGPKTRICKMSFATT